MKNIIKRRVSAALFDEFVTFIVLVMILSVVLVIQIDDLATLETLDDYDTTLLTTTATISNIFLALIYYSVIPYFFNGKTFGKHLASIKVVTASGTKPDIVSLLKRNIRFLFSLLGGVVLTITSLSGYAGLLNSVSWGFYTITLIMMFRDEGNYTITDTLGDTKVIYTNPPLSKPTSTPSNIL